MKITGACHCGKITYEAEIDPATVSACHCTDCKRVSGGAFGVFLHVPRDIFVQDSGALERFRKTADSGRCIDMKTSSDIWHHRIDEPHRHGADKTTGGENRKEAH